MVIKAEDLTPYDAAELAYRCRSLFYDKFMEGSYVATLWCMAIGKEVVGRGPTALDAIIDAYRQDDIETGKVYN